MYHLKMLLEKSHEKLERKSGSGKRQETSTNKIKNHHNLLVLFLF